MKKSFLVLCLFAFFASPVQAAEKLRLGILPVVDVVVLYTARDEGYFRDAGLEVELVPFQSALEKDAAVQAGTLDGYFGEISNPVLHRLAGMDYVIIATTYFSNPKTRMFGLIASPDSTATTVAELKGGGIAMSRGTIIDYLLGYFIKAGGLTEADIDRRDIRKIAMRVQMLLAGKVDAALLPEPLLSIAEKQGAKVLLDDRGFSRPLAIIAFARQKTDPATVKAFREAYAKAVAKVNANPDNARETLLRYKLIPPTLTDFTPPFFDPARVPNEPPSREEYAAYLNWLRDSGMVGEAALPSYEDIVFQP